MRVLVVVHGFPPEAQGGTELYALAHARTLRSAHGDDVAVLTRTQDSTRPEYELRSEARDGLRIFSINNTFRRARSFEETYRNRTIGAIADRVIDDFQPQVAHVHHLTCLSTTIVRSLADRRIPCFLTLHDYWLICHRGQFLDVDHRVCEGPGGGEEGCHACLGLAGGAGGVGFAGARTVRAIERRLSAPAARELRRRAEWVAALAGAAGGSEQERKRLAHMREVCDQVTQFVAPSRFIRDQFVRFGVPADRISVSPYGVEPRRVSGFGQTVETGPPSKPDRSNPSTSLPRLRLGFLGTLMVSKGAHVLLEAIDRLPCGSVSVDLFGAHADYHGDDSYRGQLEPLLRRPDVRVHGPISHDDVMAMLKSIDVLVVPSIWPENSPFVIHEAFLAGVPVVASRIGGIPELVRDGENGLLFAPGDPDDLATALARLIREPDLRDTLCAGIAPPTPLDDDVRFVRDIYRRHETPNVSVMGANRLAAVVLNFRTPEQTFLAVKSLVASRRRLDDIIVVDNDCVDPSDSPIGVWKDIRREITFVRTGSNLGFSGGMNVGIREALQRGAARVLLVNSDVIVPPDTVQLLERCLDSKPRLGIAGPVILARSNPGEIASTGMSYSSLTGRMRHRDNGRRLDLQVRPAGVRRADGVSGCLMMVERAVFESIGLLEEEYFFSFEDLDFCLRARHAGFETGVAGTATVYHEGGQSLGSRSPRRFYFAARNHLLLARRSGPSRGRVARLSRGCSIVALNLAHALVSPGGSVATRIGAVALGTRDYLMNRFGAGPR
ncbi:MAG TPA: glycosyltransferase [Vicinamibacterales bacterium]|nr:glycosyltransferase [Vicinamibacterales bacterium]